MKFSNTFAFAAFFATAHGFSVQAPRYVFDEEWKMVHDVCFPIVKLSTTRRDSRSEGKNRVRGNDVWPLTVNTSVTSGMIGYVDVDYVC